MVIPWIGFPLGELLKRVEPTSRARLPPPESLSSRMGSQLECRAKRQGAVSCARLDRESMIRALAGPDVFEVERHAEGR